MLRCWLRLAQEDDCLNLKAEADSKGVAAGHYQLTALPAVEHHVLFVTFAWQFLG